TLRITAQRVHETHRAEQSNCRSSVEICLAWRAGAPAVYHAMERGVRRANFRGESSKAIFLRGIDQIISDIHRAEAFAFSHHDHVRLKRPQLLRASFAKSRLLIEAQHTSFA